jgi:hypothetical protein
MFITCKGGYWFHPNLILSERVDCNN